MKNIKNNRPSLTALFGREVPPVIWAAIVFLIVAWWLLPVRNGVFMRWMEDYSLFDPTEFARNELLRYPGGLLQYAGSYLMQFMYYPMLGSAILFILWGLLVFLIVKCFGLSRFLSPLALLLPAFLLESVLVIDEIWLTILYRGYVFAPTLGFIAVAILVWCYRLIKPQWAAGVFAVATVCLYPWLGFYALLAAAADAILALAGMKRGRIAGVAACATVVAVFIIFVPLLYYRYYRVTWVEGNYLWIKGLPDLIVGENDLYLFMPFILCSLLIVFMAAAQRLIPRAGKLSLAATILALIASGGWCFARSEKPEEWRAMVLMQHYIDEVNWARVARIASNMHGPLTPELVYLAAMARDICGMPPVEYNVKQTEVSDNQRKRPDFMRTAFLFVPANYYMGHSNLAYRWAMEHTVMYGKRAFLLKYMVRCCILNGDYELARHYNDMLGRTLFHRKWSKHYGKFIDNPELISSDPEVGGIPKERSEKVFF